MNLYKTFVHANRTINIYYDPDPLNPRKEYDNGTIMVHWHRRYDLGDKRIEHQTKAEMEAEYKAQNDDILAILPLYLYDHSGLSVSVSAFGCQFDSGQVGWVFVTKSKAAQMGYTDYSVDKLSEAIRAEVSEYDSYLRGEVFGYEILGSDQNLLDSCWGYIGCAEDCEADAKSSAEHTTDPAVESEAEALASRTTYAG